MFEAWTYEAYESESEREEREATLLGAWVTPETDINIYGEPVSWAVRDDEWHALSLAW